MTRNAVIAQGPASPFFIRPLAGSGRANGQAPIWKCSLIGAFELARQSLRWNSGAANRRATSHSSLTASSL